MEKSKVRLRVHVALFAAVMVIAICGSMYLEGLSLLDAIYFSIVTVATVGYGDISPVTPGGKILALLIIFTGVSTFLAVAANATELFLSRRDDETRIKKLNMVIGLFFSEAGTRLLRFFT
ncbi:two pore domain potassium channel family protein, partial [bacterium]|nr:two pore domain potassium channel family protein [bacterium]